MTDATSPKVRGIEEIVEEIRKITEDTFNGEVF